MRKLVVSLSLLIAIAPIAAANAGQCDRLVLDDDAQDVIIGEAGSTLCSLFWGRCVFLSVMVRRLGVCWRGSDAVWHYEQTDCTISSRSTDYFSLETNGGDDRVAVLKPQHTGGYADLLPAGGTSRAMFCAGAAWRDGTAAIAPWPTDFDFYINASLGTGTDLFHGSPNGDEVNTNATRIVRTEGVPPFWVIHLGSPADHSRFDMACGWGGDDRLYGDEDDHFMGGGPEDWLDGGLGHDRCDGDWSLGGSHSRTDRSDLWRNCEAHWDAYPDESLNLIDCAATDDPLHEWSVRP